jgi:hypothetical protein
MKHVKACLIGVILLAALILAGKGYQRWHHRARTPESKKVVDQIAFLNDSLYHATVLMYDEDSQGTLHMSCTATAIGWDDDGYYFASAGHCVDGVDEVWMTRDEGMEKQTFYKAIVLAQGDGKDADDTSLLYVKTKDKFPTIAMGADPTLVGEPIMNVNGVGAKTKQAFFGWISALQLTRPSILQDGTVWTGDLLFELPGEGQGASGSALVCENQDAICGIVLGHTEGMMVALPISRYETWLAGVKDGSIPARPQKIKPFVLDFGLNPLTQK